MDESQDTAVLREDGGRRCADTGSTSTTDREQGSRKTECQLCHGTCQHGCKGGRKDPRALSQKKSNAVAVDYSPGGSAHLHLNGGGIETYENGGKRERVGERYDLVPPTGLRGVAEAMARGAERYGEYNWHGLPVSNCINHALRHINLFLIGDRTENHLAHAAANLLMSIELEDRDDRRRTRDT